jgi:hypothetical protein
MKALGYTMFADAFPSLEIEQNVNLRYKPDLVARDEHGRFIFWGECGANSLRKTAWLLKHAGVEKLVLFKFEMGIAQLAEQLKSVIAPRYRPPGRLQIVNFANKVIFLTQDRRILRVPDEWFTLTTV